jgi:TM2 domain-containing membrane protein YozV
MHKSTKAVLLSALVYPGVGHFYLNKNIIGVMLALTFSVPVYFIASDLVAVATNLAQQLVIQIQNGQIPLDATAISTAIRDKLATSETQQSRIEVWLCVTIWFIAIADAFRLGKNRHK